MLDGDDVAPVANLYVISPVTQFGTTSHGLECFNPTGIALLVFESSNGLALVVALVEGLVGLSFLGSFLSCMAFCLSSHEVLAAELHYFSAALRTLGYALFKLLDG